MSAAPLEVSKTKPGAPQVDFTIQVHESCSVQDFVLGTEMVTAAAFGSGKVIVFVPQRSALVGQYAKAISGFIIPAIPS